MLKSGVDGRYYKFPPTLTLLLCFIHTFFTTYNYYTHKHTQNNEVQSAASRYQNDVIVHTSFHLMELVYEEFIHFVLYQIWHGFNLEYPLSEKTFSLERL